MSLRQENATCRDTVHDKTTGQPLCSLLAALVLIDIEGEIDGAFAFAQLAELVSVELCTQRAGHVVESRLPQGGIVEQTFDQDHLRADANLLPCIQAALAPRQEAMGERRADAAAVEVDDALALTQREDDALIKSIRALCVDKTGCPQEFEGMTLRCEMTPQISAGRIADAQFSNQGRMVNSALPEIAERLRIVIQLVLIESGRLFEHCDCIFFSSGRWIEISKTFVQGQVM